MKGERRKLWRWSRERREQRWCFRPGSGTPCSDVFESRSRRCSRYRSGGCLCCRRWCDSHFFEVIVVILLFVSRYWCTCEGGTANGLSRWSIGPPCECSCSLCIGSCSRGLFQRRAGRCGAFRIGFRNWFCFRRRRRRRNESNWCRGRCFFFSSLKSLFTVVTVTVIVVVIFFTKLVRQEIFTI